jgi:transcriptional regulator with XRE-family HTH domain
MSDISKALVKLALKKLNYSQNQLAEMLGVSASQISRWKNHGDYISSEYEDKLNEACNIGGVSADFILRFGSKENAAQWDKLFRELADYAQENNETSYNCPQLIDYDEWDISLKISNILDELGINLPQEMPKHLQIDNDELFEDKYVRIISNIFESFTAIDGFFHAYFQELGNNDDIFENLMKIEETLLNFAVCKINIDTELAPNFDNYKYTWLKEYREAIDQIKYKAICANLPLREELMYLIDADINELSHAAEREAFGFNKIEIHPDIYMNEIIVGMRRINQLLPEIMEKLDIKFEPYTDNKE